MLSEYAAECGPDDPVLVVPWSADPDEVGRTTAGPHFVNLRDDPYALDEIPEAEQHPALLGALRALNAARSPVFTAKCDAWTLTPEERAELSFELDAHPEELPHGFASYLDLLWRERAVFVSRHLCAQLLDRLMRLAEPLAFPEAALVCVLRPALVDLAGPQEGFAVSLYVKALGHTAAEAYRHWAEALEAAVALLRGREML